MAYAPAKQTIVAAAKRQMKAAPTPEPAVADDFFEYAKRIITEEVGPYLKHFGYSYQQWYNHLNHAKQQKMDMYSRYLKGDRQNLTQEQIKECENINYEGICKIELQNTDGKPRMVCSIPTRTKYVTGPITWALEEIFSKHLKGYCGGKNLKEMTDEANEHTAQGFTKVVEGDGSAFDNTQDITLKRIDHWIYEQVEHAVYHVDKKLFHEITHQPYKTMDVNYYDPVTKKKKRAFAYKILGSVFSGDCDTTLCNTIRMCLYNRYVNDKAGLVYGQDYIAYAKGDDFTARYKPHITDEFIRNAYYKYFLPAHPDPSMPDTRVYGLGQVLKMLDFGGPDSLKFCSLRAWYIDAANIILTRDPKKFYTLGKYSRKIKSLRPLYQAAYLHQLGQSLDVNYPGLTIFHTVALAYYNMRDYILRSYYKAIIQNKKVRKRFKRHLPTHEQLIDMVQSIVDKLGEAKEEKSQYEMPETPWEKILYDIKERKVMYKIQGDYWEFMKKIEKKAQYQLTDEQLKYANQQIKAEFDSEELKSLLGRINAKKR